MGGWVGPSAGRDDAEEEESYPAGKQTASIQPLATLTELARIYPRLVPSEYD
jgi:hypothetical protein